MKNSIIIATFQIITYALLAMAACYLFYNQAINNPNGPFASDIPIHLSIIKPYINGDFYIPHPVFHLMVHYLAALTGTRYETVTPIVMTVPLLITLYLVQRLLAAPEQLPEQKLRLLPVSLSLLFVMAIYAPFFNAFIYLGQFSPNIWHSATMLLVKPFAFAALLYFGNFLKNSEQFSRKEFIIGVLCLLASTAIKPSFVITFLPAAGLYLLLFRLRDTRLYAQVALWSFPSIGLLVYQYLQTYQSRGTHSYFHDKIIFTNFGVMKLYSPSIPVSVLLVTAFPLAVVIFGKRRALDNIYLRMSWLVTIVAFLQAAFLAEQEKFGQGAFGFGYIIALFLLYVFSMDEFLGWFRNKASAPALTGKCVVSGIYLLHLMSGIYYFSKLLKGGNYY